jgi:hypothetical protein
MDNTKSIYKLQLKAQEDYLITKVINNIVYYTIISLFYFELDFIPEIYYRKYTGTGSIFCSVYQSEPVFKLLFNQLSTITFYLNSYSIPGEIGKYSFIGKDGNFRK